MQGEYDAIDAKTFWALAVQVRQLSADFEAGRVGMNAFAHEISALTDEVDALALHTENTSIRRRCLGLLSDFQLEVADASA